MRSLAAAVEICQFEIEIAKMLFRAVNILTKFSCQSNILHLS